MHWSFLLVWMLFVLIKWAVPGIFFVYFRPLKQILQFLQWMYAMLGFELPTSWMQASPPKTTLPGSHPCYLFVCLSLWSPLRYFKAELMYNYILLLISVSQMFLCFECIDADACFVGNVVGSSTTSWRRHLPFPHFCTSNTIIHLQHPASITTTSFRVRSTLKLLFVRRYVDSKVDRSECK